MDSKRGTGAQNRIGKKITSVTLRVKKKKISKKLKFPGRKKNIIYINISKRGALEFVCVFFFHYFSCFQWFAGGVYYLRDERKSTSWNITFHQRICSAP